METNIILALGNPGARYRLTRHNAGRIVLDAMLGAQPRRPCTWETRKRLWAELCLASDERARVVYARTLTYMNESGKTAAALLRHYRISSHSLMVLHDDTDLESGKMKLCTESRSAGHHGVQSIIEAIGTNAFARMRVGVRPQGNTLKADALVLKPFTVRELAHLKTHTAQQAQQLVETWLAQTH